MPQPIAIYGAGGLGREVVMLIQQINYYHPDRWQIIGFFDDNLEKGISVNGVPVLGGLGELNTYPHALSIVIAIGQPAIKKQIVARIHNQQISYPTLIHPTVMVLPDQDISIGQGSILCAGVIVTVNIIIGQHVLLNLYCTVGHDARIGDFCSLMPAVNVSGEVSLGEGVYAGNGAVVLNQRSVGDYTILGAATVVNKSVPAYTTVVGVPARPIKSSTNVNRV